MAHARAWCLLALAGVVVFSGGCNLGALTYFLSPESLEPAILKQLASTDPKKDTRVVILTYTGLETRAEFIQADRQLTELLARQMTEMSKGNDEKLTVIPPRKVEAYKNSHPNWREDELEKIGKDLDADYVIYLEINSLSLYERRSTDLFRGRASISINLVDVRHPEDHIPPEQFSCVYPSGARGPVPVGFDVQPMQFRQDFLSNVAQRLARYFVRYPKRDRIFDGGPEGERADPDW
jgi:hypothetical protein